LKKDGLRFEHLAALLVKVKIVRYLVEFRFIATAVSEEIVLITEGASSF
jgi:hypothetical protein